MPALETVRDVWIATLVIYAVVLVVVAALLALILAAARRIREGVAAIWTVGQKVASNTIHIALLDTTNHLVGQIAGSASGVVAATAALTAHAEGCQGCPACISARGGAR
jgi:hypothetical protein